MATDVKAAESRLSREMQSRETQARPNSGSRQISFPNLINSRDMRTDGYGLQLWAKLTNATLPASSGKVGSQ